MDIVHMNTSIQKLLILIQTKQNNFNVLECQIQIVASGSLNFEYISL